MAVSQGRFQVNYEKIRKELEGLIETHNYLNLSKAFAHWYLSNFEEIDENDLGELIIDGDGDNGIDAMIINNNTMTIYQFKFPDKSSNIMKMTNETTVLKLINGYKKLTSSRKPNKFNDNFMNFREKVKTENIFKYVFKFVCFTSELSDNATDALETNIESILSESGNTITFEMEDKRKICDKYDRKKLKNTIEINLKFGQMQQSYNLGSDVLSWSGFAKAEDLLDSCNDYMDVIFDENIRNYEGDNTVNQGIIDTASSTFESKNFFFYHNGIVFICDKCYVSTGNRVVSMSSTAIVNGCQSVVSLSKARSSNTLKEDVFLPIRIIQTNNIDLRAQITEYLNSQTKIKDSYFLSNNPFVRELQEGLKIKGFFLERLSNEYSYKSKFGKVEEYSKDKILPLEKTIQVYVASYFNDYASASKRGKNEIFNKDTIDSLITEIDVEKVINSLQVYNDISKVITKYRKCRRVDRNDEFLDYLGLIPKDKEEYDSLMEQYLFMNTADLLLINAFYNLNKIHSNSSEKIKIAIEICKAEISKDRKMTPSAATKNSTIFSNIQATANSYFI